MVVSAHYKSLLLLLLTHTKRVIANWLIFGNVAQMSNLPTYI